MAEFEFNNNNEFGVDQSSSSQYYFFIIDTDVNIAIKNNTAKYFKRLNDLKLLNIKKINCIFDKLENTLQKELTKEIVSLKKNKTLNEVKNEN